MNRRIKVTQYSGGKMTDLMMKYPYNHGGEVVCAFGKNSCALVKGIDTIFTCEETFYPWNSHYKITKEIDELAKKNDCTICVTGAQDMNWGYIISTFAGASDNIMKIKRSVVYNFKDYEIVLAKAYGVNRNTDLMNTDSGYLTTDKSYMLRSMETCVKG